jgi:NADH-quinone oxidoreductase subunit N
MIAIIQTLPFVLILSGAIALMLFSLAKRVTLTNYNLVTVAFLIVTLLLELIIYQQVESSYLYPEVFNKMFIVDKFSTLFSILFLGGAILTLLINNHYFKSRDYYNGEFFALLLFALLGMMMLSHSNELITSFISLELASISIYILVGYNRYSIKSSEAMLKYIILGSLAGAFFILGSAFVYGVVGSTYLGDIYAFVEANRSVDLSLLVVGLVFIMVTLLFKVGAAPFHSWVIDVYQGAPFPVMMFMATTFKVAIFSIILRLYLVDFVPIYHIFSEIIKVMTIITLLVGSLLAISQSNLKRMLAGSSIVHVGYMLIAIYSVGLGSKLAASSIIFYLISYFLSAVGAFGILSFLAANKETKRLTFNDFKGFAHERPYMAAMMTIFMLSLAGFPSTIGFLGKFYIFMSAIESGEILLAGFGVMIAFISLYYYFKLIALMYFYPTTNPKQKFPVTISSILIIVMAVMIIWGGIGTGLIPFLPGADGLITIAYGAVEAIAK